MANVQGLSQRELKTASYKLQAASYKLRASSSLMQSFFTGAHSVSYIG
jgi:division protein CdvB (Snf7/Vps24/ESCRT-III family)